MRGIARELRINEGIRARVVRVIGETGEQLGIMPLNQALQIAQERSLDLVEVAPTADPPVCRILDYGKFKYEQAKKDRKARKGQRTSFMREIRLRPKIDEHDIDFKTRLVKKLLEEGDKVRVSVIFRGREMAHPQLGKELLDKIANALSGMAIVEKSASLEGSRMNMILAADMARRAKGAKKES